LDSPMAIARGWHFITTPSATQALAASRAANALART
jgi:hypothetical protein